MAVKPEKIQDKLRSIDSTYKHGLLNVSRPYEVVGNAINNVDDILWGVKYKTNNELILGLANKIIYTEKNKRSVIKEIEFILENNLPSAKDK